MRKLNTIFSTALVLIFLLHGIMGSFMLLEISSNAGKALAWAGVAVLAVHAVIGVILTLRTLQAAKHSTQHYMKQNALFWTRRVSGICILILSFFHIGLFGGVRSGAYILFPFTTVRLVAQLLLIAALAVHLFVNIRPLLISLGVIQYRERRSDISLILSVILLFITITVILYYVGWQQL